MPFKDPREAREYKKQRRKKIRDFIWEIKKRNICSICGEERPECLEFHHRDPSKKVIKISRAAGLGWSVSRILEEIKKCDIVCSGCHFKIHQGERRND